MRLAHFALSGAAARDDARDAEVDMGERVRPQLGIEQPYSTAFPQKVPLPSGQVTHGESEFTH